MIEDTWQSLLSLFGAGSGATGVGYAWFQSRQNKSDIKENEDYIMNLAENISAVKVDLGKNYPTRREINAQWTEIRDSLRRIEDKLDSKADK